MRSVRNRVDGEEPVDRLVQIRGSLARIVRVAVGHEHYLASGAAGELYSWGGGASVLGHGPDLEAFNKCPALRDIKGVEGATIATPRLVERLVGTIIVDVSAGGDTSSFALSARGEAFSWGYGWEGRLGHGGPILLPGDSDLPYQWYFPTKIAALALQRIVRVSGGYDHALFLSERGEVFSCGCAGVASDHGYYSLCGKLGHGYEDPDLYTPKRIAALHGIEIVEVRAGGHTSLVRARDGRRYAFGWNTCGQLGFPDCEDRFFPALLIEA